jgi:hypothetical protein
VASWTDWLRNWRRIADAVPNNHYDAINVEIDGTQYEVLRISNYDADIDGDRRVITTGSRDFDDRVALFSRRTRDIGFVRVIEVRGRPRYVLEPGADALDWAAVVEGTTVRQLALSVQEGALGRRVGRLVTRRQRHAVDMLRAKIQALRERLEDAELQALSLRAELNARESDLRRSGSA